MKDEIEKCNDPKQLKIFVGHLDNVRKHVDAMELVGRFEEYYDHFDFSSVGKGNDKHKHKPGQGNVMVDATDFGKYAYEAVYDRYHIEYHWRDENDTLLAAEDMVDKYRPSIALFALFEEGIANKDELILVEAVDKWEQLQRSTSKGTSTGNAGNIPWKSVFESQCSSARAALLPSQQAFSSFMKTAQASLFDGAFTFTVSTAPAANQKHKSRPVSSVSVSVSGGGDDTDASGSAAAGRGA